MRPLASLESWPGSTPGPAAALAALLVVSSLGSRASAQASGPQGPSPAPPSTAGTAPAQLSLPLVPRWQLVLPAASTGSVRHEGPPGSSYWREATVATEWRHVPDAELRLELTTARLELAGLALSSQLATVPGRERGCLPDCRAPGWATSLRLKYDAGDVGPLRQTGPQLELEGVPMPRSREGRRFLGAGLGGSF